MKVQKVTQTNKFKQDSQEQTNPPNKQTKNRQWEEKGLLRHQDVT